MKSSNVLRSGVELIRNEGDQTEYRHAEWLSSGSSTDPKDTHVGSTAAHLYQVLSH